MAAIPPSEFDPAEMARIKALAASPALTPLHHTQIEASQRFEDTVQQARELESNRTWFFLGLAYSLIRGLDRSLFELYNAAGNVTLDVKTVQTEHPVILLSDAFAQNPWAYKIQGVRQSVGRNVVDFLASYRFHLRAEEFNGKTLPEANYRIDFREVRMADPLITTTRRAVNIWCACPVNLTTKKGITIIDEPGPFLKVPRFGLREIIDG